MPDARSAIGASLLCLSQRILMGIYQAQHVLLLFLFSSTSAFLPEETAFIKNYFRQRHVSLITIYSCSQIDALDIVRSLHQSSSAVLFGFEASGNRNIESHGKYRASDRNIRSQGVFVDVQCSKGQDTARHPIYPWGGTLRWLFWSSLDLDELASFLETLPLNVDADVILAVSQNGTLQLFDLFKTNPEWSLSLTIIKTLNLTEGPDLSNLEEILHGVRTERKNFHGMSLQAAVVLHEIATDPQKNPTEFDAAITSRVNPHLDSESKFGYAIYTHLQELFNFTISIEATDSWGYLTNSSAFDGMVGMLNRGEVQIGITPAILNEQRLRVVDFTVPTWRLRTCFLFRHPRLLVPYKALAEPFLYTTWTTTFIFSVIVVILLRIVQSVEIRVFDFGAEKPSWSVPILTVVGVLSQQGSPTEPLLVSGRVIILTKLVLSLLLYAFYTSAIVTFLLTPIPRTIRTAEDLIRSPLTLAVEDYSYNHAIFPNSIESLTSRIWREKVGAPHGGGFVKVHDAVKRMRVENFAFYSEDSSIYVPVDETFDDFEKCDLSEVELSAPSPNGAPLQKHSPYREIFNQGLLKMWEHGIRSRQRRVWAARKPQCLADNTRIAAVGLEPIFPAHALLLVGLASAVVILFNEVWSASAMKKRLHGKSRELGIRLRESIFFSGAGGGATGLTSLD